MTCWASPMRASRRRWLTVGLFLVLFTQLVTSAAIKSPTFDEPFHTARTYYVMTTGNWDMQAGHLPLLYRLLGPMFWALPDLPPGSELPRGRDSVEMAREIILALDQPYDTLIFPLRVLVMGLTMVLGASLYRWAAERHGPRGGLLALFAYVFSPNLLAHGRLVTTDIALTSFFFLAVYACHRLLERPTLGRCVVAGLALGLALGSKASALALVPILGLLVLARSALPNDQWSSSSNGSGPWHHRCLSHAGWFAGMTLVAVFLLWMLYGFDAGPWIEGWPALPLATYLETLFEVGAHVGPQGHPAFLMGQRSGHGWVAYFPIALGIKTPLPTLIGALAGGLLLLLRRRWWIWLTAFLPIVLFLAASILSSLNIGYRHILPIVPFLILALSALVEVRIRGPFIPVAGGALALWLVVGTLRVYPDYLAYFNELVEGPRGGHRYLTDSNLDWGQDLIQLRDYMEYRSIDQLSLSYFGNVDPAAYGIRYEPLPSHFSIGEVDRFTPFSPAPGFYAVSVTSMSGQYFVENPSILNWFAHQEPLAEIGYSINVYRVAPDPTAPAWVAMCHAPGAPLKAEQFAEKVGRDDLRFVHLDCRESWAFVDQGAPGWYVVPTTEETDGINPPVGSWLTVYEQENYDGKRLFTVYRWEGQAELKAHLEAMHLMDSLAGRVGDTLEFLGHEMRWVEDDPSGPSLRLLAYWRVLAEPDRSLSLMAHVLDQHGSVTAVGDALGVPVHSWVAGDIIVQEHRLAWARSGPLEEWWIELGAYALPTVERLPVFDRTGVPLIGDAIRLPAIGMSGAQ